MNSVAAIALSVCASIGFWLSASSAARVSPGDARLPEQKPDAQPESEPDDELVQPHRPLPPTASGRYSGAPPITRLQILDLAKSALGTKYRMGGEAWDPFDRGYAGTDCSGLIAKAWQLPHASESWEELPDRPTTATLTFGQGAWLRVSHAERRAGDAFVRFDKETKHAFIFDKDDQQFAANASVWVFEAAAPLVRHKLYALSELTDYRLLRRSDIDDVGLVGRSRNWLFGDFVDTFREHGGELELGQPFDRDGGVLVHRIASGGVAQDFHEGVRGQAMILRSDTSAGAYLVSGKLLTLYLALQGPAGVLGFPRERERSSRSACGEARRQAFEHGYIAQNCGGKVEAFRLD